MYLRADEGWLYLAVVIDTWSRAGIGWSMSSRMTAQLVCDALQMGLWRRKLPENIITHSSRLAILFGSSSGAAKASESARQHECKGCCYDNTCVESFSHSMKVECIPGESFADREIMRTTAFNYIGCDYNSWRRHSACGGLSPEQFKNQTLT